MTRNITVSIKTNEAQELERKAVAKGITKCAYVRNLIKTDLQIASSGPTIGVDLTR